MKKISRRSFITAMAAVSAAGVLAACGSSSSSTASSVASSAVSSEATSSAASLDETGTHTVVDHGGNEVEVPNKVTRVVIDQIPILSTYMAYFEGSAPYIVGYCGSFKSVISDTVLKNIAPELLESSDTVYAQSDLNIEEIMKLNPDVILYNAGNSSTVQKPCIDRASPDFSGLHNKKERQILRFDVQYLVHLQGLEPWAH